MKAKVIVGGSAEGLEGQLNALLATTTKVVDIFPLFELTNFIVVVIYA